MSAVVKNSATYEHVEPDLVGNKRRVLISDLSGRSNIIYKLKELGIKNISDESIVKILEKLKILENEGLKTLRFKCSRQKNISNNKIT